MNCVAYLNPIYFKQFNSYPLQYTQKGIAHNTKGGGWGISLISPLFSFNKGEEKSNTTKLKEIGTRVAPMLSGYALRPTPAKEVPCFSVIRSLKEPRTGFEPVVWDLVDPTGLHSPGLSYPSLNTKIPTFPFMGIIQPFPNSVNITLRQLGLSFRAWGFKSTSSPHALKDAFNTLIMPPLPAPGEHNDSKVSTPTCQAHQTGFNKHNGVIPGSKEFKHRDREEGKEKFYKVLWGLQVRRLCNIFKNIFKSLFSGPNPSYIYNRITCNFFPYSGKHNLPNILAGVIKQILFRANTLCCGKTFGNRNVGYFTFGRTPKPFAFDNNVNMKVKIPLASFYLDAPETPFETLLDITPSSKGNKIFNEVMYGIAI